VSPGNFLTDYDANLLMEGGYPAGDVADDLFAMTSRTGALYQYPVNVEGAVLQEGDGNLLGAASEYINTTELPVGSPIQVTF
jgi:hypothetical protein